MTILIIFQSIYLLVDMTTLTVRSVSGSQPRQVHEIGWRQVGDGQVVQLDGVDGGSQTGVDELMDR